MTSNQSKRFQRPRAAELARRLAEPRHRLQVVSGARQVGKTTLVQQVTEPLQQPVRFLSADEPTLRDSEWLRQQWEAARLEAGADGGLLVVDQAPSGLSTSDETETTMSKPHFPPGWDEHRVQELIQHYESQSEEEAVAEDEATLSDPKQAVMEVPAELAPAVRELIAKRTSSG